MKTNEAWGNDGKSFEEDRKQELEKILNTKTEEEPDNPQPKVEEKDQDADTTETEKYDNILRQNYGFSDDEINDKTRKLAKSWTHIQSMAVKNKQESQQYKNMVENLNTVLDKHPSLYEKLEQAVNGQYTENPTTQETTKVVQPKNTGELGDVNERDLISAGYITADELEGLDEYTKQRKLLRAEAQYIRETEVENYMKDIQTRQEAQTQKQQAQKIEQENQRRLSEGFDKFIVNTGVNFAELDPAVVDLINKRVAYTRDYNNPSLIAEDAFDLVGPSVLAQHGITVNMQPTPTNNVKRMEDTGTSFSKGTSTPKKKLTLNEQLTQAANERYVSSQPRSKFNRT